MPSNTSAVITDGMIASFADAATRDIFNGTPSRAARASCPVPAWPVARRKRFLLNRAASLRELAVPPGNRLERLRGDQAGQWSIRVNAQYRLCFPWEDGDAHDVEVTDYHA